MLEDYHRFLRGTPSERRIYESNLVRQTKLLSLGGPVAILSISRDTCSDSIAKLFRAYFCGGIAQLSRDMLQNGVSHRCACVKLSAKGGYRTILGEC